MHGLVIRNTGSWYTVLADDGTTWEAKVKGNFRLRGIRSTNPVAIGDRVTLSVPDQVSLPSGPDSALPPDGKQLPTPFITDIEPRKNYVIRRATNLSKQSHIIAANVDQCFLIVTLKNPETATTFIDRFLASAEAYRIPVVLVFNKTDLLCDEAERQQLDDTIALYQGLGYTCRAVSAETGEGVEALRQLLDGNITLLSGNSGVGKSTLINRLFPHLHLKTDDISDAYNTGRHTTTYSEMYPISTPTAAAGAPTADDTSHPASFIIDTPGIKGFGTFDIEPEEVGHYFKEIFSYSAQCRFSNCTHTHEPGCAVLDAVTQGHISPSRYNSYLSMLQDYNENRYR